MDPLSVTASIIAVLQAANAVISVCYDYRSALKETPWALTKVADEVKSLRLVLETLEAISRDLALTDTAPQSRLTALELLCAPDGGLLGVCQSDLSSLEKKLSSPSWYDKVGPKRRAAIKATGWRLKETDAKEALSNIERYKSTLTLAITADEAALLLDIRRTIHSLSINAADIHDDVSSLLESFNTMRLDDRKQAILRWLSQANPALAHDAACKVYQDGRSSWLTDSDEFKKWQNRDNSFLWLSGFPGAGKTILSSKVINFLHQNKSKHQHCLVFFYCDFRRHESQDPLNLVGSIVSQLCMQLDAFPGTLDRAFDHSTKISGSPSRPDLQLLKDVLVSIGDEKKVMLVIDALDECNNRAELLSVLVDLHQKTKHIKLLVTSRNEADISQTFLKFPRLRLENRSRDVSNDINSYMKKRLDEEPRFKWLNDSIKADIEHSLSRKAKGMFRWVQCQLDEIALLRTIRSIRKALDDLPSGLYETYENILARTSAGNTEIVRRILLWVAFSTRPMKLWAIWEAIAIEQDLSFLDEEARLSSPRDVIDLCGNLLSVSDQTQEVTLVHLSVKEFLLSPTIRCGRASSFALSSEAANNELALNCLTYLSFTEFQSGPSNAYRNFHARVSRYPFLEHAARSWPQYVIEAEQPESLIEAILQFFDPNSRPAFLSWVQVLNASGVHFWDVFNPDSTPLYYAASFGLDKVVQRLVNNGNDLNAAASRFGGTALHGAVLRNHLHVVQILLGAGADPNIADWNQDTPLHTAAGYGLVDAINLLLSSGASTQAEDLSFRTPYDWAVKYGETQAQKMLRQADVTAKLSSQPNSKSHSNSAYYCCSCGRGPYSWEKIRRCPCCNHGQCDQCRKQVSRECLRE